MSTARPCPPSCNERPAGPAIYRRRHPERTVLYAVFQDHLESYLAQARSEDPLGEAVPKDVEREFRNDLQCGILAYGSPVRCARIVDRFPDCLLLQRPNGLPLVQ